MQWHQLDYMQTICTSLQTDYDTNTSLLKHRPDALPDAQPTVSKHRRSKINNSHRSLGLYRCFYEPDAISVTQPMAWHLFFIHHQTLVEWALLLLWFCHKTIRGSTVQILKSVQTSRSRTESRWNTASAAEHKPCELSGTRLTAAVARTWLNAGQPQPDSNFWSDENRWDPQTTHVYVPHCLLCKYLPVNGLTHTNTHTNTHLHCKWAHRQQLWAGEGKGEGVSGHKPPISYLAGILTGASI